jgi:hypothetical protein
MSLADVDELFPLWQDMTDNLFCTSGPGCPDELDPCLSPCSPPAIAPVRVPACVYSLAECQRDHFAGLYGEYGHSRDAPSDLEFEQILHDSRVRMNPMLFGFIPMSFWPNQEVTFGALVTSFFRRRNVAGCRFAHKLFNALRIGTVYPNIRRYLGVEWITRTVLRVDKNVFSRLLSIKVVNSALFYQQGNFPSHGFVEMGAVEAGRTLPPELLEGVDFERVRLLIHHDGGFKSDSSHTDIENCKWINNRRT